MLHTEKALAPHSRTLAWKIPWSEEPGRLQSMGSAKSRTQLSNFAFTFHFHALEKEMATHSSVLAWRIPGMGEPGGLPSMGSHRVRHNWSDLAAAAVRHTGVGNEDVMGEKAVYHVCLQGVKVLKTCWLSMSVELGAVFKVCNHCFCCIRNLPKTLYFKTTTIYLIHLLNSWLCGSVLRSGLLWAILLTWSGSAALSWDSSECPQWAVRLARGWLRVSCGALVLSHMTSSSGRLAETWSHGSLRVPRTWEERLQGLLRSNHQKSHSVTSVFCLSKKGTVQPRSNC